MYTEKLQSQMESSLDKFNFADTPLLVDAAIFEMCTIERRVQEAEEEAAVGRIINEQTPA